MASENGIDASEGTAGERVLAVLNSVQGRYEAARDVSRNYTPRIVRFVEVILGIALFVMLAYWFYLYLVVG
jgi:hypothetical protein